MNTKELLKKYWFVCLIGLVLISFIGLYSYQAYKNRDVVVKNKQVDGKYIAYSIDGEPVYADDLFDGLYLSNGLSQSVVAFQRAIFNAGYETTDEMRQVASNSVAAILSNYSQDYIDSAMKQMGYTGGFEDLNSYYIDSQKQEKLIREFLLAHPDDYITETLGENGRLIYHILVKCDVTPVYDDQENIIAYEANPTEEQKAALDTVLEELKAENASFEMVAYQHSEDTGSANSGGYIGIINEENKERYDQFFAEEALRLQDGEVSEPIVSQFGYHIIKNSGSKLESIVEDYYFINELGNNNPTMTIKAIMEKAKELGFEIVDEDLKAMIDAQIGSEE